MCQGNVPDVNASGVGKGSKVIILIQHMLLGKKIVDIGM